MRNLRFWSAAPARNVEAVSTPTVNVLRGLVARATTPLLPDDYLKLLNPLWSARELRGLVVDVRRETEDSATVTIKPGWGFCGDYQPGQYLGIGVRVGGCWHWRSYSLTSVPRRDKKLISITVKATPEGFLSSHLVNGVEPGTVVRLAAPRGDFALPNPAPAKVLFVTAGSGITPVMAMARTLLAQGHSGEIAFIHYARTPAEACYRDELAAMSRVRVLHGYTRSDDGDLTGRFGPEHLAAAMPSPDAVFVCGPTPLVEAVQSHCDNVYTESFVPPVFLRSSDTLHENHPHTHVPDFSSDRLQLCIGRDTTILPTQNKRLASHRHCRRD